MVTEPRKPNSLRQIITIPFVLQIVAAVGLVGYLSFRNGQQAVNDVAVQLRREISYRIEQKLRDKMAIPHLINQINAGAVRRGELKTQDRASERYLALQLQSLPDITWLYYGSEQDGAFVGATRTEGGGLRAVINDHTTGFQGYHYRLDSLGERLDLVQLVPDVYDARTRPWYERAVQASAPVWSAVYSDFASPQLILSAVQPVTDTAGVRLGVVAVDFSLEDIGGFLQSLQIGQNGEAFVLERSGMLVASSTSEHPYQIAPDGRNSDRIPATRSSDPLIAATAAHLAQQIDLATTTGHQQLEFLFQGERQFVQLTAYQDGRGLDWLIAVVIPESDFMARIDANTQSTLGLSFVALLFAVLIGVFTARWLTTPLLRLHGAASIIAGGQLDLRVPVDRDDEVGQLARSFNQMTERLQIAFRTLQANEQKYRSLFEDSSDTILILTPSGDLVDTNPAGRTMFGLATVDGAHIAELFVDNTDRQAFVAQLDAQTTVTDFEVELRRNDGSQFDAAITTAMRYDANGDFVGYQAIVHDVTVAKQNERLLAENIRLETELKVAQRLQQMLLPTEQELAAVPGLDIATYMAPADEVGGDYYDVLQRNGTVKIGIGDVTGHGLESGVLMLMTQTAVRTLLEEEEWQAARGAAAAGGEGTSVAGAERGARAGRDPSRFLTILNRAIYDNVQRMRSPRSLTLSLLDYQAGRLTLSGYHEELIVVRRGGSVETIDTFELGFPIGLRGEIEDMVKQVVIELDAGDGAVLYTDGITEAENERREQYGLKRLLEVVQRSWAEPAAAVRDAIIQDVRDHIGQHRVYDDITLVVLKQR